MFPFSCPFPPSGEVAGLARHGLQPCGIGAVRHVCHAVVSSCHLDIPASAPAIDRTGFVVVKEKKSSSDALRR